MLLMMWLAVAAPKFTGILTNQLIYESQQTIKLITKIKWQTYAQATICAARPLHSIILQIFKNICCNNTIGFGLCLIEIINPWNTQAQQTKTHKNNVLALVIIIFFFYQSSIISILRRRCRRTEERNKLQWGDTNVPLLCSPLSAWENTTDRLSGLAEHKPSWMSLEFRGWGVGCCGLAIHFFPLQFCLGTRAAACLFELS